MKKLLILLVATFITSLSMVADNVVCDFTVKTDWNGVSSYTSNFTSKDGKWIVYNANNNVSKNVPQWDYIRIGAKKAKASSANVVSVCKIQTKTAIAESIDEVAINIIKAAVTSSTVDEIKVIVSDDDTFDDKDQTYTATTLPKTTSDLGEFSIAINNPANNKFYSLEITVTNKTTSAGVIDVNKVTFKESVGNDKTKPELAFAQAEYTAKLGDDEFVSPQLDQQDTDGAVTYSSSNLEVATINEETGELNLVGAGTTVITATSAETETYAAGKASYTLTVIDPNAPFEYVSTMGADFTFENPEGLEVWKHDNTYGLKGSAYLSGKTNAATAIAVSPELDLTCYENITLDFDQAFNNYKNNNVMIGVEDFEGYAYIVVKEVGASEWTEIEEATAPAKFDWNFFANNQVDLSAYSDKKVQIGFKYVSTATVAGTWEIKNIAVRGTVIKQQPEEPAAPIIKIGGVEVNLEETYDLKKGSVTVTLTAPEGHHIHHKHVAASDTQNVRARAVTEDGYTVVESNEATVTVDKNGTLYFRSVHPESGLTSPIMAMTFNGDSTALTEIAAEGGEVEWFDLQGRRVAAPAKGALYILKQGSKVSKRAL